MREKSSERNRRGLNRGFNGEQKHGRRLEHDSKKGQKEVFRG